MLIFADLHCLYYRCCTLLASEQTTEDGSFVEGELKATADDGGELVGYKRGSDGNAVAGAIASVVTIGDEGEPLVGVLPRLVLAVDRPGGVELVFIDDDGCQLGLHTRFLAAKETPRFEGQ
jgi:hypothetical protein